MAAALTINLLLVENFDELVKMIAAFENVLCQNLGKFMIERCWKVYKTSQSPEEIDFT